MPQERSWRIIVTSEGKYEKEQGRLVTLASRVPPVLTIWTIINGEKVEAKIDLATLEQFKNL